MSTTDIAAIDGELTIQFAARQCERLCELVATGTDRLDLSAVGECDSAGLQLLLAARATLSQRGQSLALMNPSAAVRAVLASYGLDVRLESLEPNDD